MVSVVTLPRSAEAYQQAQQAEATAALTAVQRQWSRLVGVAWLAAWQEEVAAQILAVVLTAQGRMSRPVGDYVSDVLQETGQGRWDDPMASVAPRPLVGVAGDGRSVAGLLAVAAGKVQAQLARGVSHPLALHTGGRFLNLAVSTVLSDTARQMESLHTAVRPVSGYVRMLDPPSCSRCAILAGRRYRWNTGFKRHPGCNCRHIPAAEYVAGDLTVDTRAYFDSLTEAEQDRIFTKAGAEAIRLGADPAKVVNARRGMNTSQPLITKVGPDREHVLEIAGKRIVTYQPTVTVEHGRRRLIRDKRGLFTTEEGTLTRRGKAQLGYWYDEDAKNITRLMPESIIELGGGDRARTLAMLKAHGYIK